LVLRGRPIQLHGPEPLRFGREPACLVLGSAEDFARAFGTVAWSPPVDWSKELLVVVQRGLCPTGGYSVAVTGLSVGKGRLEVRVELRDPSPSDFVTMVATYPQAAVALPRRALRGVSEAVFTDTGGRILGKAKVTA